MLHLTGYAVSDAFGWSILRRPASPAPNRRIRVARANGTPEKVDPLSDLGVTKLRAGCPIGCSAKKQETKELIKSLDFMGYFGAVHRNPWWAQQGSNL